VVLETPSFFLSLSLSLGEQWRNQHKTDRGRWGEAEESQTGPDQAQSKVRLEDAKKKKKEQEATV
jgi:hypothetical protein